MKTIITIPEAIARHLFAERFTCVHKMYVGLGLCAIGVTITSIRSMCAMPIHYIGDFLGASLHGIGLVPVIEKLQSKSA